jgi:hypothetical protein
VTAARLAARCVELLDGVAGPIAVSAPPAVIDAIAARVAVAGEDETIAGAVCVLLGEAVDEAARAKKWTTLAARLAVDAPLVVVDHNQPRTAWRRLVGAVALALAGQGPARARHPTAREVHAHGFTIDCLRLDDGERVQLVRARRR